MSLSRPKIHGKRGSPVPVLTPAPRGISAPMFLLAALASLFFIFAVYSPSLGFQFVLDDHRFTADPRLQESGHIYEYFSNYVWAQFTGGAPSFYRPIFILWMRMNFIFNSLSPWGWHLLSIAKHLFVAVLLDCWSGVCCGIHSPRWRPQRYSPCILHRPNR